MKNFFKSIAKVVARFYNWLPSKYKLEAYRGISAFVTGVTALTTLALTQVHFVNQYVALGFGLLFVFYDILVNIIQDVLVAYGNKLLVQEGNSKAIEVVQTKIDTAQAVLNKAP